MENKGFTLVELAIVLVIIGFLITGVFAGRELIKQSKFRSLMKDKEEVSRAINTFRAKYNDLPGDTKKATIFFGNDPGCGGTRTTAGTCNGDGNGVIAQGELYLALQHLYLAGLLSFAAPGYDVNANGSEVGVDIPQASFGESVGYSIFDYYPFTGNLYPCSDSAVSWIYVGCYNHMMLFGKNYIGDNNISPFLSSSDAFEVDTKFDDGKPGTGSIFARPWGGCEDLTTNTDTNSANYLHTNLIRCMMFIRNVY